MCRRSTAIPFLDADYAAMLRFHTSEGAAVTLAAVHRDDVSRYGGVTIEGQRIVGFQEKNQNLAQAGSAPEPASSRATLHSRPASTKNSPSSSIFLSPKLRIFCPAAFEVDGFFLDIGIPEDLDRAQTELAGFAS